MDSYTVRIDSSILTEQQLFARFTDTIYLGFSGIENWDAFYELMQDNFEVRDMLVTVIHEDLSGISPRDRAIYTEVVAGVAANWPDKINIIERGG
jgi:hypothetical protein